MDPYLKKLALEAQEYQPQTAERRKALDKLLSAIQKSGKLSRPICPAHLLGLYEDIYAVAVQRLFIYITKHIDKYDPEKGEVLQWVNFLMNLKFPDAIKEVTNMMKGVKITEVKQISLDKLEQQQNYLKNIKASNIKFFSEEVIDLIEEDPENMFSSVFTTKPEANFKDIAISRHKGYSWEDLHLRFDVKIATLSNFYRRHLDKFKPWFEDQFFN